MRNRLPHNWGLSTLLVAVGAVMLYLLNAQNMPFMDPDEARCAVLARGMLAHHSYLVPMLADQPYFDKPPLYFWMLASVFRVLGPTVVAARLVSAVGAVMLLAATYELGRVLFSPRTGRWAAVLLGTTVLMAVVGRFVRMDVWLTAFVAWAFAFWSRVHFAGAPRRNLGYGYACIAAACLTKGLLGILLPVGAIGAFLLQRRDGAAIRRARLVPGLAFVLLLAGPWFGYMCWKFPEYASTFFWKHHFARLATSTFGRSGFLLYLPAVLLAGFLPWTAFVVGAGTRALPLAVNRAWPRPPGLMLCFWWLGIGILPMMLSRTQLPVYVLPVVPALALITAHYLDRVVHAGPAGEARWCIRATVVLMGLSLIAIALINWRTINQAPFTTLLRRMLVFVPLVWGLRHLVRRSLRKAALGTAIVAGVALTVDTAWVEGAGLSDCFSARRFVDPAVRASADVNLLLVGPAPQYGMEWYLEPRLEVRYLPHFVDFQNYIDYDKPLLALVGSARLLGFVRAAVAERLTVLAQRREWSLIKVRPPTTGITTRAVASARRWPGSPTHADGERHGRAWGPLRHAVPGPNANADRG